MITKKSGDELEKHLIANETVIVRFPDDGVTPSLKVGFTGARVSTFSTWGLTFDNFIKPDIGGPGGHILSTWPTSERPYDILSGTSMSTVSSIK